jgi:hypothetical protein
VKSKWLSRILFLLAGFIIGAITTSSIIINSIKTANDLMSLSLRAWEENQAIHAYQSGNHEIARYALNHFADILQFYYDNKSIDGFPEATSQDLAFTYIRLGNLAQSTKKANEAEQFYDKGHVIHNQYLIDSGKEVLSREKLIASVNRLDNRKKAISISFSDAIAGLSHDVSR